MTNQNFSNERDSLSHNDEKRPPFSWKQLWKYTGPGWLMSIAYLDPGNIESDLQSGATTGYSLLWILFWSTILGLFMQIISARLGVVTGKNLAQICKTRFSLFPRIILWIMTELAIIGSDIQQVVGSAVAIHALSNQVIPLWVGVLITACDTMIFLLLERKGMRYLEAFFAILIGTMAVTFGIEYMLSKPDTIDVIKGTLIPSLPKNSTVQAVGIIGAVIMPHNIFLHSSLVQSRKVNRKKKSELKEANFYNSIESSVALLVSFIINLFVVSVFAKTFYVQGIDVGDIGLHNAGEKLREVYGAFAYYVWAIGLLAAGQSSTMTGTYTGQVVMEGFLDIKISSWIRVAITRCIAIIPSVLVAILATDYLDVLDEWLNVLQSIQLPFALIPLLVFACDSSLMGKFKNSLFVELFCWLVSLGVVLANFYLVFENLIELESDATITFLIIAIVVGFLYVSFLIYLLLQRFECCQRKRHYKSFVSINSKDENDTIQEETDIVGNIQNVDI